MHHHRSPTNAISLATRGNFGGNGGIRLHATGDDNHDDNDNDNRPPRGRGRRQGHTLAILTMPHSGSARIANEAILETAMSVTSRKLRVVLRATFRDDLDDDCNGDDDDYDKDVVSLTQLRWYAGEVHSMAWDAALGLDERERKRDGVDIDIDDGGGSKVAMGGKSTILLDRIELSSEG